MVMNCREGWLGSQTAVVVLNAVRFGHERMGRGHIIAVQQIKTQKDTHLADHMGKGCAGEVP